MIEDLKQRTAKGLFWGGISTLSQQIFGMVFGIVIARILAPEDYGLVAMLAIFTAIANSIMDSGFTTALVNREKIEHKDYNAVFWFNVFIGVGMYFILFFVAPLIANFYRQPVLTNLSRLIFLSFAIASMGVAHNAFLLKNIMAKQKGIIDVTAILFSGTVGVIFALNGFAFWGLAIQQVTQTLISVLLRWYFSSWRPTLQFDFSPLRNMFGFSFKVFVTNIFWQVSNNLFSVFLGRFYGKIQTGYYAQGFKWANLSSQVIVGTMNNIAQPVLVEAKTDLKRQLKVFRKMLRFEAFIIFPSMLGLAFVSREFIYIALGEKWLGSVIFLQLFCIWGIASYLNSLYTILFFSHGKSNIYMYLMIVIFVAQLISLYLCSSYGILIMVCVYIGIYLLGILGWQYFAYRLIGIRIIDVLMDLFPYMAVTGLSIVVAWLLAKGIENVFLKLAVKVFVVIIVYSITLWKINSVIFRESIDFLKNKLLNNTQL
jgi:O-antigen/teichoic acid export membrane protein